MPSYDDSRFGVSQHMHLGTGRAAGTSVVGSRLEIDRKTMMSAVTIKDWNVQVLTGATATGTQNSNRYNIGISKSLGGTGAVTPFGSAVITAAADGSVVDGSLTETNMVAGDDLILSYEVGTALPAASALRVEGDVMLVERFT